MTPTRQSLLSMANAGWEARILTAAVSAGIFEALGRSPRSARQVARQCQLDARATDLILKALVALGLARLERRGYVATAAASRYLRLDSPAGIAWLLRHHNDLAAAWAGLDQVLRCGRPARPARSSTAGPAEPETFIHAMHDNARQRAPILARLLAGQPITRMLDVGGGSGAYCLEFCRRRPRLQATLFDRADVLRVARKILAGHRQARRIDLLAGDLDTDQLPGGFDFVLLSQVIHSAGPAQIRRWLSKIRRALQPGGLLAIQDFLTDPTGTRPRRAAVFAINMLVNTPAGRTYSRRELSTWLRRAGFVGIRSVDSTDAAIALMLARRPDR